MITAKLPDSYNILYLTLDTCGQWQYWWPVSVDQTPTFGILQSLIYYQSLTTDDLQIGKIWISSNSCHFHLSIYPLKTWIRHPPWKGNLYNYRKQFPIYFSNYKYFDTWNCQTMSNYLENLDFISFYTVILGNWKYPDPAIVIE